jgi:hypothetical protein
LAEKYEQRERGDPAAKWASFIRLLATVFA